jgi:hypothetical protein
MKVENHDIAIAGGAQQIDSILIRLKENFELLAEGRREEGVERPVFRI